MNKKLLLLTLTSMLFSVSFAFEGIIEQVYTDVETKEQKTFFWYIDNDNIKLEIMNGEEMITLIPDFTNLSLNLYGNKADQKGELWYTNTSISQIKVDIPKLRILEQTDCVYKEEPAKEIKLMSQDGLLVVQYLNTLEINMKNMITIFAESKEFNAISLASDSGFPVSSVVLTENEAIYTLTTTSITEKTLSNSEFLVPSNYKLFVAAVQDSTNK